jgi:hypothetical protein
LLATDRRPHHPASQHAPAALRVERALATVPHVLERFWTADIVQRGVDTSILIAMPDG